MKISPDGIVDQTRGLLAKVEEAGRPGEVPMRSVCGDAGLGGLEGLVAKGGYWSLTGRFRGEAQ